MWCISMFRYVLFLLCALSIILFLRRLVIVRRSGGPFFAPYHISGGIVYIHNALCFSQRIIPLTDIKRMTIHCIRGMRSNGSRYMLFIEKKKGKTVTVFFGKTKKNERLVKNLKKETKKYAIKIAQGLSD